MGGRILLVFILRVRSASFRYVTKSFQSKLNFSNISHHFVDFDVANDISSFFLSSNLCTQIIVK